MVRLAKRRLAMVRFAVRRGGSEIWHVQEWL
jgi:hypothetical protein